MLPQSQPPPSHSVIRDVKLLALDSFLTHYASTVGIYKLQKAQKMCEEVVLTT